MEDEQALICDTGTGYLKIGWSDDHYPRFTIPAIVGRPMLRFDQKIDDIELKSIMVGDEAAPLRSMLELNYPLEEGQVKDWDDMNLVWDYGFKKVHCNPTECGILMTEPVLNPVQNREKLAQVMFEQFGFPQFQVGIQALMSLFAGGMMTGTLLDAGDGVTHCIPVYEGFVLTNQIGRMNIAGRHLTSYLIKLLFMRGYAFNSTADFELVREIKEKFCFVAGDLSVQRKLAKETTVHEKEYRLPDNTLIQIGRERFEATELLFNPHFDGHDFPGAPEMVFNCINQAPIDLRKELYDKVIISGGSSMFPGFPTRMSNEIHNLYRERILKNKKAEVKIKIKIVDNPNRRYNVFIGAAVYAKTMMKQPGFWIEKKEYDEVGPRCIAKISDSISM